MHASRFDGGSPRCAPRNADTWFSRTTTVRLLTTHSVSAGLDYPAIGPEHVLLRDMKRVEYTHVSDAEAIDAFRLLSETEGLLPALESAHAIAHAAKIVPHLPKKDIVLINLSGRGDKDVESVLDYLRRHEGDVEDPELARVTMHPAARKWGQTPPGEST